MKKTVLLVMLFVTGFIKSHAQLISAIKTTFDITAATIYVDSNDFALVKKSVKLLQQDVELLTGKKISIIHRVDKPYSNLIVIGSITQSAFVKELQQKKLINTSAMSNKWEAYQIQTVDAGKVFMPSGQFLIITGSDRRGTAYGVFELSKQLGVSPWYWWADVPVMKQTNLYINTTAKITDAPKVKYRGIFINDEAPCLSNWSKEKFGGFNHLFYEKVFELMLRQKANYLWPAMWGNAFYDDDSLNIKSADEYGIVIGTSHHEPLMRAHDEWRRYGNKQKWNYDSTEAGLKEFWRGGMQRATNEKIVSVGMRGDGDEPMSRETATALLERIVKDQRQIIEDVTKKPASETPQLWALYKEVQDYYDKGMRVPDDVTLLLCDDNWGNLRKLPKPTDAPRKGGYGIYYHFDYVGGPRNYKWVNTNSIPRVWEQMHLAYEHNVKDIWIVNVGDIKPMEYPISFFLDYAWNPDKIGATDLQKYAEQWSAAQFGAAYAKDIADIISKYSKYNSRRKPELLDENTYSLDNYGEFGTVAAYYNQLAIKADVIRKKLPEDYQAAYYQLVLFPVKACANLNDMYFNVAQNRLFSQQGSKVANVFADAAKELYLRDSLLTKSYHQLNAGKWNHMMRQTHIGYRIWQEPRVNSMPVVKYIVSDSVTSGVTNANITTDNHTHEEEAVANTTFVNTLTKNNTGKSTVIYEHNKYISIEAAHFTRAVTTPGINWQLLPDHGRTGDAVTAFPVTAPEQKPAGNTPHLEYEFYTMSNGAFTVNAYFSPTLNFYNSENGLQYAVSIDNELPQIISINKEDKNSISGIWNKWVGENIIIKKSEHKILSEGKHTIKYWMVNSGVVLQKLVLDFGGVKPSYLGPPETIYIPLKK
jgi:Glycosyl hydrolase family 115/Gylcosyl hydrolase family 115 C-terminal domain